MQIFPPMIRGMDDDQLWRAFETQAISLAEWTHNVHLRTAYLFTQRFSIDEAHLRMRAGIIRLNHVHGLIETSARGYFDTLTRAWLLLVADASRRTSPINSEDLLGRCPALLDRSLPLQHYSRDLLKTVRARAMFVEPDLAPLPEAD